MSEEREHQGAGYNGERIPDQLKNKKQPRDILVSLFRKIGREKDAFWATPWETLMQRFLNDKTNMIPENGRDRSSARGNLNKALLADTMTLKSFFRGLKFLGVHSVTFHLEVDWGNNQPNTVYSEKMPIKNRYIEPDVVEEIEPIKPVKENIDEHSTLQ